MENALSVKTVEHTSARFERLVSYLGMRSFATLRLGVKCLLETDWFKQRRQARKDTQNSFKDA